MKVLVAYATRHGATRGIAERIGSTLDVRDASEPKEFAELRATLRPRGERIFFGAYDPDAPPIGLAEKLMKLVPASRQALPAGDFRDWPEIEAFAEEIANELAPMPVAASAG